MKISEEKISGMVIGVMRRPVTVLMISLMIVSAGLFALVNLKTTFFPSLNIPVVAVILNYRNVSPEDMSRLMVEPVEGAVASVEGIKDLEASVRRGNAFIRMSLAEGVNTMEIELKVREAIDRIRDQLPREAAPPIVFQFDPDNFPIMNLSIRSGFRGLEELRYYSTTIVEPLFERIDGVASAETNGGLERQIRVELDAQKMALHQLMPREVEQALSSNNFQIASGNILEGRNSFSIRAYSYYQDLDEIAQTIVKNGDQPIRVRDLGTVVDGFRDVTTLVEINGQNSVSVSIQKKSDANTVDVTEAVIAMIPEIESKIPGDIQIAVQSNQGEFITQSIDNLSSTALQALIFVALIILVFMGGWRSAIVVCVSIPISMAITFAGMYFADISLNVISISGLALAVGLLVDNSIVVLESIIGKMEQGYNNEEAATRGTSEIKSALIGATMTTMGVFIPLLGISGFTGQLTRDLSFTIVISIASSWLAAMVIVPVLAARILKNTDFTGTLWMERATEKLEQYYVNSLRFLMARFWIAPVFILLIIAGTVGVYKLSSSEFIPDSDSGTMNINLELATGTKLVNTAETMREFSKIIQSYPEVKTVVTNIGARGFITEPNRGSMSVTLVPLEERERSTNDISVELRRKLTRPGMTVSINTGGGGFGGGGFGGFNRGIRVSFIGPDIEVLKGLAQKIVTRIEQDTSVINVDFARTNPAPELGIAYNREAISRIGIGAADVSNAIKTQVRGTQVGFFRDESKEVPIEVRYPTDGITGRRELERVTIATVGNQRVPLSAVSSLEVAQGLSQLSRRDRESVLDVSITTAGDANEKRSDVERIINEELAFPEGYRWEFTGSRRDEQQGQKELLIAMIFALCLTYMIMAAQFENLRDPLIVMLTIPLAYFGSLVMLFATGTALGATASIGIVILVGIVVNNGIVMVDHIHFETKNMENERYAEFFLKAAKNRMRPVLLTAATTVCSMIPLAIGIGSGAETWSPLARSVIGGLTFATILTLYLIPLTLVVSSKKRRYLVKLGLKNN